MDAHIDPLKLALINVNRNLSKLIKPDATQADVRDAGSGSLPNLPYFPGTSSPTCTLSFSPVCRRRRLRNISKRNVEALAGSSPPKVIVHLPRDPVQPRSGSISDVHSDASADDEEMDALPTFRPRSQTCPEHRSFQRRKKAQIMSRPLTPPPGSADDFEVDQYLSKMAANDKIHLSTNELPLCIPESPRDTTQDQSTTYQDYSSESGLTAHGSPPTEVPEEGIFVMDD